jgi:hypothetical protein
MQFHPWRFPCSGITTIIENESTSNVNHLIDRRSVRNLLSTSARSAGEVGK